MKILIINSEDKRGGAARAAYRLHHALLSVDVDSKMYVQNKASDELEIIGSRTKIEKFMSRLRPILNKLPTLLYPNRTQTLFSSAIVPSLDIEKIVNEFNPDIVHLHWINSGMMNIKDLSKIKIPIVWSLHDMWAFTGGCHYNENCDEFEKNCFYCKVLNSEKQTKLSKIVFNQKKKIFSKISNLTIIGLSKWLTNTSKKSTLFKNKKTINLPNLIDITRYKPIDKKEVRKNWNLPLDKKLVLFGAVNATGDPRKGFKELSEALKKLKCNNIEFVIFGSNKPKKSYLKAHYVGHISSEEDMISIYNAVDVTVVPSLQENLSNVIMESLSCGTPVVSFNIGGNSDMIEHKNNGYLAQPFDSDDLSRGIDWILTTKKYQKLCENAREKIINEFESSFVVKQYIKLYEQILSNKVN